LYHQEQPDIVLLDLRMPGMDGLEVLQAIREDDPEANVILCTAHGDKEAVIEAMRAGASDFLPKPIDQVMLESALRRAEERIHLKRELQASQETLRRHNERLEEEVKARTVELEREIEERKSVQEELRQTLVQLEGIKRYSPDLITVMDRDGRYLMVNQAVAQFLERESEEIVGRTFGDLLPPRVADLFTKRVETVFETEDPLEVEDEVPHPNRESVYATVLFPLFDQDGYCYAVCGIARDITERKRVEEAVRTSDANLRALISSTEDIVVARDQDFRVIVYNEAFAHIVPKLFGVEAAPGLRTTDYLPADAREHWESVIDGVLNGERHKEVIAFEVDGELRYYELTFNPIVEEQGNIIGIAEFTRDITDHRRALKRIERSEGQLQAILNNTQQSFVLIDPSYTIQAFNQVAANAGQAIYGQSMKPGQSIFDFILPSDTDSFIQHFQLALRCESVTVEKPVPGGRWFSFTYNPIRSDQGEITGVCFNSVDITERKQAQEALVESEERYRRLVEGAPDILYIYSNKRGALYWSQRVEEVVLAENSIRPAGRLSRARERGSPIVSGAEISS
jgi:PAS domain S-box-containing protein